MTGMKEGAGEDPFAEGDDQSDPDMNEATPTRSTKRSSDSTSETPESKRSGQSQVQIPYMFRRDSVQDGRERVPLFLHTETKRLEREAQRELEDRFDSDVSLTDLREALVKVGLQHLDDVERQMEEWGYGMTFDE